MTSSRIPLFFLLAFFFSACGYGDKKMIITEDFGDTSFVNKNFAGNKKEFNNIDNICDLIPVSQVADLYKVEESQVLIARNPQGGTQTSCRFLISFSEQKFDNITGIIAVTREVSESEDLGEIAKAAGHGTDWVEAWELKKKMSKSAEYISDMGKAAIWFGSKRNLLVKLDGYNLSLTVPGSDFHEKEKTMNRDYKSIALAIAKNIGLL